MGSLSAAASISSEERRSDRPRYCAASGAAAGALHGERPGAARDAPGDDAVARGAMLTDLAAYASRLDPGALPRHRIVAGSVAGRSGTLAVQGSGGGA